MEKLGGRGGEDARGGSSDEGEEGSLVGTRRSRRKSLAPRGKVTVSRLPEHDPAALGEQEDSFLFTDLSGFFTNLETLGGLRRAGFLGSGPSPFPGPPHLSGVAHRSSRRLGC